MSGHGTSFFESKTWKNIMKYVYGLGAAVVIMGALFKIMHWPGASLMLIIGLSTEAVIFIMSVMEPVHLDADWSRVFPELSNAEGEGVEEIEGVGLYDLIKAGSDEPGSQADKLADKLGDAGIDNALIEIDNEEVPIMDGSAKNFLQSIKPEDLIVQSEKRKYLKITKKIKLENGNKEISIEPNQSSLEVNFQLNYKNKIIGKQKNIIDFQKDNLKDVTNSRTFCLFEDIEKIKKLGLAKGIS